MTGEEGIDLFRDRLSRILHGALGQGASDLHLGVGHPPMIRVSGELVVLEDHPGVSPQDLDEMIEATLSERARQRLGEDLVVNVSYELPGVARFRMNVYRQRGSVAAAFRFVPIEVRSIQELGLPRKIGELVRPGRGLVLVAGPSGSGRSTTLAAMLDLINSERSCHIVTVEEPIEFVHRQKRALVHQREVGTDVRSFAKALGDVLRQDPDVILIGAMRDAEVMELAIVAAETGHLVVAPSDAQNGPQAIDRITDAFPEFRQEQIRVRVATVLRGVVSQQLLQATGGEGRVAACEVLVATEAARNLIGQAKVYQLYSVIAGGAPGMQSMDMALAELVRTGRVTQETALGVAQDKDQLIRLITSEPNPG